ncbi:sensory box histidine kinase/response regulator [Pedobacter sp. BAL39]|uniref:PAS domain-containing protein n=1 Tax=Pedobacter sp. BAL39 TaxID=391596 RepID=UPI000155AA34|nr:PAS domain-containing protein [Pedobacter sp. BAL39]EDM34183.1 sensory box histidine kinase/response regulator [Pedobacter sp. BAL39]
MKIVEGTIALLRESKFFYTITVDMEGRYSYVSPSYDAHFGFLGKSLVGEPFLVTLHPDDGLICAEVGAQSFVEPDELHQAVLRKHDGNGGYIHTHWEFRALFDEKGDPEGIFCIGYNITEHIQMQSLAVRRDEQLSEIGLMQAHQVRKPLANILGLLNMLDESSTIEEILHLKNLLLNSATDLDNVVRKIIQKSS